MYQQVIIPQTFGNEREYLTEMAERFSVLRESLEEIPPDEIEGGAFQPSALMVCETLPVRRDTDVLLPMYNGHFKPIEPSGRLNFFRLFVPFGSGQSGVRATRTAVLLARHFKRTYMKVHLYFYHTTWKNPQCESDQGKDHMIQDALEVQNLLERIAIGNCIDYTVQVDLEASTVTEGVLRAAFASEASLIVMARGDEVRTGSYVDQLAELSPIPILICAQEVDHA